MVTECVTTLIIWGARCLIKCWMNNSSIPLFWNEIETFLNKEKWFFILGWRQSTFSQKRFYLIFSLSNYFKRREMNLPLKYSVLYSFILILSVLPSFHLISNIMIPLVQVWVILYGPLKVFCIYWLGCYEALPSYLIDNHKPYCFLFHDWCHNLFVTV